MTPSVSFSARHDPLAPLLVVLHDDGSDEREAMAAGRRIWPGAPIACIRGHYRERKSWQHLSQPAAETAALDLEASTVDRLSDLIANTARREPQLVEIIGVGIGGGADASLAILCCHPGLFAGAILCWPRRKWSAESLADIATGNGVEVLILTDYEGLASALSAKLMLSSAGHYVEIKRAARHQEAEICRAWIRRELRGEN